MKFKKNLFKISGLLGIFIAPYLVFAETYSKSIGQNATVSDVVSWAHSLIVTAIIPLLFALATAAFIWGVISYYLNPDNEEKRKKGKEFIVGGLVALFVMLTMWGIVTVLANTFNVNSSIPVLPE